MHRLVILIVFFIVAGCTVHNSAKAVPASVPPTTASPAEAGVPAATKIVDRGAEMSRAVEKSAQAVIHAWQVSVIAKLTPYMRWPENAPSNIERTSPTVSITIDRQGHVLAAKVVKSSGYEAFDVAARKIFKRAGVLPPPPPELPGNPLTFRMAVTFTQ